jgi:hypothetical protein
MNVDEALLMGDSLPASIATGKGHLSALWTLTQEVRRQHALIEELRTAAMHDAVDDVVLNAGPAP